MLNEYNWIKISSQEDMNKLFKQTFSMHDGMLKEFHVINRGFVEESLSMIMSHSFDGLFIFQTQWEPCAVTILLINIEEINIKSPEEYFSGHGLYLSEKSVEIKADDLYLKAKKMFYKITPERLGPVARLGKEVPSIKMSKSSVYESDWRRCEACHVKTFGK